MNKVYRSSVLYSFLVLILAALNQLLVVPLIVYYTSEHEYGVYAVFMNLMTTFTNVVGWLGAAAIPVLGALYHKEARNELQRTFAVLKSAFLCYSIAVIPVFALVYLFYVERYLLIDGRVPVLLSIATLLLILVLINSAIESSVMGAIARLDLLNRYRATTVGLGLILSVLLVPLFKASAVVIFVAAGSNLLLYFLILRLLKREQVLTRGLALVRPSREEFKELFVRVGGWAFLYSAMRLLILLDPLMLSFVVAPELIAQYTYYWLPANYLVLFLWKFPENLQPFLIKNFAANALDQNRALYRKLTQRTLSLAVVVAVLYVLILPTFLKLWVGVHNTELWASVVFALLIVCLVSYRGDIAVLYSRLNYRALFLLSFAELLVKVVVVVVFYERLSFMVTAVGHLIAHLLVVQLCAKVLSFRELRRVRLT